MPNDNRLRENILILKECIMYEVTLSIPVYNASLYIEKTLMSALNQTFLSIEYLIIDDCSSDDSLILIDKVIANHSRKCDVRIIKHSHNMGTGIARNTAIDNASGKYLYWLDSDDLLIPNCIEILYQIIETNSVDFVVGSNLVVDNLNYKEEIINYNIIRGNIALANYVYRQRGSFPIYMCNKLYSIPFLRKNDIRCKNNIMEDPLFTSQLIAKATSCVLCNRLTYYYIKRSTSSEESKRINGLNVRVSKDYTDLFLMYKYLSETVYKSTSVYSYFMEYCLAHICNTFPLLLSSKLIENVDKYSICNHWSHVFNFDICKWIKILPFKPQNMIYLLLIKYPMFSKYVFGLNKWLKK